MSGDHDHEDHDHEDHDHEDHDHGDHDHGGPEEEHAGIDRSTLSPYAYRIMAMRDLLVEQGVISAADVEAAIATIERLTPTNGARLVARAWLDPDFRGRLLDDAQRAAAELDIHLPDDPRITALENRDDLHHVVVCTLCSCYPRALLGRPPDWYRSIEYRSRVVIEPREVLGEFGVELADDVAVSVFDSTADHRYLVIPVRPAGTEDLSEQELVELITRDAMIGTAVLSR
jgi:nitrile hydratase